MKLIFCMKFTKVFRCEKSKKGSIKFLGLASGTTKRSCVIDNKQMFAYGQMPFYDANSGSFMKLKLRLICNNILHLVYSN